MRLKQVEIEGFRGFLKAFPFDLDGNIILLTGGNGLGKTTFFDAIEWCLTGTLHRYEKSRIEQREHPYIVNRFYNGKAKVKLVFNKNDREIEFIRIGDETKAKLGIKINGEVVEEKKVIRKKMEILLDDPTLIKTIREKDLSYLLLRSQLLAQEHTAEFIRALTPTSRFSQLSKILGTDRFETFYKKIGGSYRYIDERIRIKEGELRKIIDKLTERNKLLMEEEKLAAIPKKIKNEKEYIKDGLLKLHIQAWTHFPNLELDEKTLVSLELEELMNIVMDYCGQLTFRIDDKVNKTKIDLKESKQVSLEYSNIDAIIEKDSRLSSKLKKIEDNSTVIKKKAQQQKKALLLLQTQSEGLRREMNRSIKEINLIKYLKENVDAHIKNKKTSTKISEDVKNISSEIDSLFSSLEKANENLMKLKRSIKTEEKTKEQLVKARAKWTFLKNNQQRFFDLTQNIFQLGENSKRLNERRQNKLEEIQIIETQLTKSEKLKKTIQYELSVLLARYDEYKQLLNRIKDHIKGSICPTCGYDWGTEETLKEQAEKLSEIQSKEIAVKQQELDNILNKIERFNKQLVGSKAGLPKFQKDIEENQYKLNEGMSERKQLVERLLELQMVPDSIQEYKQPEIVHKLNETENQLEEVGTKLSKISPQKTKLDMEISSIEDRIQELEKIKTLNQKRISNVQQDIIDYEEKGKSLDPKIEEFTDQTLANLSVEKHKIMEEVETKCRKSTVSLKKVREEFDHFNEQLSRLQEEHQIVTTEKAGYEATISDFQKALKKFRLIRYADLGEAISTKEETLDSMSKLNEQVVELFQVIEYVRKRRKVHQLRKEIYQLESRKRKIELETETIEKARKLARRLNRNARRETGELVDKLIKGHESLINTFYGQVNAHPRFKTVHFVTKRIPGRGGGNAIFIEAIDEYGKKRINPSLTFSSAQLNVLAVSIFLAIHTKQTWSTLDTILMDDPIQNMDDLNILSYIDLIHRICKDKQIIISTHDDNIYRLMQRKLCPVNGEKLICYEYTSLGSGGPEIKTHYIPSTQ